MQGGVWTAVDATPKRVIVVEDSEAPAFRTYRLIKKEE